MKLKETETTEGAPVIKNSDKYWQEEFKKQRASRLQESVDEYMQDGEVDAFFEDLRTAIQDLIDYHGKQKESAQTLMKVVSGHRPLQTNVPGPALGDRGEQLTEDEYFKRKYNLAEANYYDKRAQLDMEHSKYYWDKNRNKPDVKADGHSYQEIPDRY